MLHLLPPLFRSDKGKAKAAAPRPQSPPRPQKTNAFIAPNVFAAGACDITTAAERLLAKSVTFEDGGYGASVSRFGGRTHIEWRNLSVARISNAATTETDELSGISGRYYVHLRCDSHRRWNAKTAEWTEWEAGGYAIFPGVIVVERIHGRCHARASGLENFTPGNPRSKSVEIHGMEMSLAM
jgi:hypothetical protein